jgi:DNA polymerase-3 subunit beta
MLTKTEKTITATAVIALRADAWNEALSRVKHAVSHEETRYYLNGVHLEYIAKGKCLRFVATDGHRLAHFELDAADAVSGDYIRSVILPLEFVQQIIRATSKRISHHKTATLKIEHGPEALTFSHEGADWQAQAIDGTFPDYARVIPQGKIKHEVALSSDNTQSLLEAAKAMKGFAKAFDRAPIARFAFSGSGALLVSIEPDGAKAKAEVTLPLHDKREQPAFEIGFNASYVADILHSFGEHSRVKLEVYPEGNGPAIWRSSPAHFELLMPCRV